MTEIELRYPDKEPEESILARTPATVTFPVRRFGMRAMQEGWHNRLFFGDNLGILQSLLAAKESGELCSTDGTPGVRLIYIDPPFATNREFKGHLDQKAYIDKVDGPEFLEFLRKRLIFLHRLLADDGCLFVHLDAKKGHYCKILLDEIFGEERFENEIIWHYPDNLQGNVNRFPNNHNSIYLYSKSDKTKFKRVQVPLKKPVKRDVRVWDSKTKSIKAARNSEGKILYKTYEHKWADDVWEIGQSCVSKKKSSEFLGYPTQKPEELLRRVIESATKEGDLVCDVFAGSGTTCAVADKLGRRWIGIDKGQYSILTIQRRLAGLQEELQVEGGFIGPKPFVLYSAERPDEKKTIAADAFCSIQKEEREICVHVSPHHAVLSAIMLDLNHDGKIFHVDAAYDIKQLQAMNWKVRVPIEAVGPQMSCTLVDIHGNETRAELKQE